MPSDAAPVLQAIDISKAYPISGGVFLRPRRKVHALQKVSLNLFAGQTLGIVGESGCGKSTLARTLLRLHSPSGGQVLFEGCDLYKQSPAKLRHMRQKLQMVFQDPFNALNPRRTILATLEEPLAIHTKLSAQERRERAEQMVERVGLSCDALPKYPHQFSGGQRQRIGIARAMILNPKVVVCDEAVSALDVSVQAQVLNVLASLQQEHNLAYLFISHDLAVVGHIADQIAVMYLGRIVEQGPTEAIQKRPQHPYTQMLWDALPLPDPSRRNLIAARAAGEVPQPTHFADTDIDTDAGCSFVPRCMAASARCHTERPLLRVLNEDAPMHQVACHNPLNQP